LLQGPEEFAANGEEFAARGKEIKEIYRKVVKNLLRRV
jgi:hypothetical protein